MKNFPKQITKRNLETTKEYVSRSIINHGDFYNKGSFQKATLGKNLNIDVKAKWRKIKA